MPADGTPPSPDRIRALGLGYTQARVLLSAVELGVFAELAQQPLGVDELSARLGLHPRGARDFCDTLVSLGLLERHAGLFTNAPEAAQFLDPAKSTYIGGALSARDFALWARLTDALRTGEPQLEAAGLGNERFAARYESLDGVREATRFQTGNTRDVMPVLARKLPWERFRTFIDIGTAAGNLPVQVALVHPHLTGGGFDLPPIAPAFEEYVASFGLSDRLRFYPGSFLTDPLPSADVLTMSNVLHDWSLEQRLLLLGKAHAALPPGGVLIVSERFIDDDRRANVRGFIVSLQMLLYTAGGANFSAAECCRWMREAGFAEASVLDLDEGFSVAMATK